MKATVKTLIEVLQRRAATTPDEVCYTHAERLDTTADLTCAELRDAARAAASGLLTRAAPGDRVLLLLPTGLDFVIAFYGCLYAGLVAVPLHPPKANDASGKIPNIINDCQPRLAVVTDDLPAERLDALVEGSLPGAPFQAVRMSDLAAAPAAGEHQGPLPDADALAFLQYSSGSTGDPKGVMIAHRNIMANMAVIQGAIESDARDVFVGWLPFFHDMGMVMNLLLPMANGSRSVFFSPMKFAKAPLYWLQVLSHYRGTVSGGPNFAFDSCLRKLTPEALSTLDLSAWRVAPNGAEPVRADTVERFAQDLAPAGLRREAIMPSYGMAEAVVFVCANRHDRYPSIVEVAPDPTLGEALAPVSADSPHAPARALRVVGNGPAPDGHLLRIVHDGVGLPDGHVGEVWVRGDSIAAGYWGRPALSEATFRAWTKAGEGPFLRTGDIGFMQGGELFLLGRLKDVLIVHGRNLYPQDLELCARAALPDAAAGDGALFAANEPGRASDDRLVLVQEVRPRLCRKPLAQHAIDVRTALFAAYGVLLQQLVFVPVGAVLKTTSGKVMRSRMREHWRSESLEALHIDSVDLPADLTDEMLPPTTATEQQLARLWCDALALAADESGLPANAHFLQLGGDSLAMARLQDGVRRHWRIAMSTRDAFEHPTLSAMAAWIDEALAQAGAVVLFDIPGSAAGDAEASEAPLSFAQQRLWFLAQLHGDSGATENVGIALRLEGTVDRTALDRSMTALVRRHAVLRCRFHTDVDGEPRQSVMPAGPCAVRVVDLRATSGEQQTQALQALMDDAVAARFRLDGDVLLRGMLVRLADTSQVLLWAAHHIAADGWSMGVLVREWATLYNAERHGRAADLPALPLQYTDYARWQRGASPAPALQRAEHYWHAELQGLPTVHRLPLDRPRGARPEHVGGVVRSRVDARTSQQLKRLCAGQQATLFMGLHAVLAVLVSRFSGEETLVIGSPVANRESAALHGLIGMFVNTVVLRSEVTAGLTLRQLIAQSRQKVTAALEHQGYPFERLVEQLSPVRQRGLPPLCQLMLVLQNSEFELPDLEGLTATGADEIDTFARVDLALGVHESPAGLSLTWTFNRQLLEPASVERLASAWTRLLIAGLAAPDTPVQSLPLLDDSSRREALLALCGPVQPLPSSSLAALLHEGAMRAPEALAVVGEDEQLTHAELQRRVNQLAHWLRAQGVQPDDRVGLCLSRGAGLIVAVLGVLQAGAAYVALDAAYPVQRLALMCADPGMRLLLSHGATQATAQALARPGLAVVDLDAPAVREALQAASTAQPTAAPGFGEHSLAYVIYTSGSTGQPKGVMVEHRQLLNHLHHHVRECGLGAQDRVLQFASLSFDASVEEIFPTLSVGATLVVRPSRLVAPDAAFMAFLQAHRITVADLPTAFWHQWAEEIAAGQASVPPTVRLVVIGGEKAETRHLAQFRRGAAVRVLNTYGPTEATIYATSHELAPEAALPEGDIPIGRPIANTRLYLLDAAGEPVPPGVVGEIWIAGAGVARGYLGEQALSAQRFRADPFEAECVGTKRGGRMYRSGDLGRCDGQGRLHYLGRNDDQVKLRGYRIELGEIERRLGACEGVREAVVLVRSGSDGQPRLVAYVVAPQPQVPAWQARLQAELPAYMVPSAYVVLQALPLTPNGKIDRQALPEPQAQGGEGARAGHVAPSTPTEQQLAALWARLLGLPVDSISAIDNFFAIGGHSMLVIRLLTALRQAGWATDAATLYESPTLRSLASRLDAGGAGGGEASCGSTSKIPTDAQHLEPGMLDLVQLSADELDHIASRVPGGAGNVQDIYPLAPLQEGIYFLHLLHREHDPYVLPALLVLDGPARLQALLQALQGAIDRHDALRTLILSDGLSQPVQVVLRQARLQAQALQAPSGRDVQAWLQQRLQQGGALALDRAPLLQVEHASCPHSGRVYALVKLHHLIEDITSSLLLEHEVRQHMAGRAGELAPPAPYRDFVAHALRQAAQGQAQAYFRHRLGDVSSPTAPYQMLDIQGDGRELDEAREALAPELAQALRQVSRDHACSPAALVHAAWALVVAASSARHDIVFGTVLSGRLQGVPGIQHMLGMFINTLPLRLQLQHTSAAALLAQTQSGLSELLAYEQTPLAHVQRCSGVDPHTPLFTSLLNYRHEPEGVQTQASGIELLQAQERTNYPFIGAVEDHGSGGFTLGVQVRQPLHAPTVLGHFMQALHSLVQALQHEPQREALSLAVLPPAQRQTLLHTLNDTAAAYPRELGVHQLIQAQARATPDRVALVFQDESLSYAQLLARASRLAHHLREQGVGAGSLVGLHQPRGLEMVVAALAIWQAGAAYVPLDPAYPVARLRDMLHDSGAPVLLSHGSHAPQADELVQGARVQVLLLDRLALQGQPDTPPPGAHGETAYVIYTSGSTGRPKGVVVRHQGVNNFLHAMQGEPGLQADDVLLAVTSLSFDIAVLELFLPLTVGACCVIASRDDVLRPQRLVALMQRHGVSVMQATPSVWRLLLEHGWPQQAGALKVLCGGEALAPELAQALLQQVPEVWNLYGPTETTIWSSVHRLTRQAPQVQLGRPIANTQLYVLDEGLRLVPPGVAGQLYIGGDGLAQGYLHRADLTAERFIAHPFEPGQRLYQTGDLVRRQLDGTLHYLGRNDDQVKIRGFRIELGEIEARLAQQPGVAAAVVVARADAQGQPRLVGYVTTPAGAEAPEGWSSELRQALGQVLPEYMVPAVVVVLPALPQTANGKIDRKALPAPEALGQGAQHQPPQGELEQGLAQIWSELLQVPLAQLGREADFFELGGHSLLAVRVVAQVRRQLGRELDVRDVFSHSSLQGLAQRLQAPAGALVRAAVVAQPRQGQRLALSFAQQRLWVLDQMEGGNAHYNMPAALRVRGRLDVQRAEQAFARLVQRHEPLRTVFASDEHGPYQVIRDTVDFAITRHDLRHLPPDERWTEARRLAARHASQGFDLARDLMLRVDHIALDEDDAVLLMTLNHIAADGWSLQLLAREFTALYDGIDLAPLTLQYADYAQWQREWLAGDRLQEQLRYWTQQLADLPPVHGLPLDRPRPAAPRFEGARLEFRLDASAAMALRRLARDRQATLFMVMHAAMSVLVARHGDSHDIVMGTPVANRLQQELDSVVGFFVNMLVLRVDCAENQPFIDFLDRVKGANLAAQAHQEIPFELLVEALRPTRSAQYTPLFQIMLRMDTPADGVAAASGPAGVAFEPMAADALSAKYELSFSVEELDADAGLLIGLEYNVDLFDAATIERLAERAHRLLTAIAADPSVGIHDLPLIGDQERHHLVQGLNATAVAFPLHQPIQCLFEAQAARTPEAIALVCDDERMSYGELNRRANRLAHWLRRERGVRPDQLVGLCVGRSLSMIVGILGILKSGAAYVPLDAEYPADRLAFMAEDASLQTVLTEQALLASTGFTAAQAACLDDPLLQARLALEPDDNLDPQTLGLRSDHLAYVIYTSGSTGLPKGVMVEHRSLVNLTMSTQRRCGLTPEDGLLQFSTINFDPSVVDIFSALCSGSRLVLRTAHWMSSVAHFWASCARHDVTILSLPTAYWHELANDPQAVPPACLRRINIGGEQVNLGLVSAWYRKPRAADIVLLNNYGPTEATVDAAVAALADGNDHIGRAIENVSLFVLQAGRRLAPFGAPGELYIGGAGLARGYLNQSGLTAERFVANPFHRPDDTASSPRLYATGDRVRYLPDGNLRFLDRLDDQVKVRGFRVELGEIESRLAVLDGVANAVVLARDDGSGDRRLVAYVARSAASQSEDAALIRAWQFSLARDLPDYMVPALFVVLESLPLTPNGKVDKQALPAPDPRLMQGEVIPASTPTQQALVTLWADLLHLPAHDISITTNFFALGGHSLLLVRLVSQVASTFEVKLDIRKAFELPDIQRMADFIDGARELRDLQQAFEARSSATYSEVDV